MPRIEAPDECRAVAAFQTGSRMKGGPHPRAPPSAAAPSRQDRRGNLVHDHTITPVFETESETSSYKWVTVEGTAAKFGNHDRKPWKGSKESTINCDAPSRVMPGMVLPCASCSLT